MDNINNQLYHPLATVIRWHLSSVNSYLKTFSKGTPVAFPHTA